MYPNGSGMLLITVTDDEGRRIEKQSFEETKAEIVKMLRGVYGQNVSEPTGIYQGRTCDQIIKARAHSPRNPFQCSMTCTNARFNSTNEERKFFLISILVFSLLL
jgi:hypothetical protein